jgi:Ca-activated chloride channel family protein
MRRRLASTFILTLACCLLLFVARPALAQPSLADGVIVIDPPPLPDAPTYLTIKYHRVSVTIEDQVATTHVDQVFVNESGQEVEGVYLFPLPEGAAIDDFAMWVDGERLSGEILPADEARRIYEDIVRRQRDPALLEYAGRNTFRARIYPIPARSEKRVEIRYRQILSLDNGLVHYRYPLDTERFSPRPIEDVSIRVEVRSREAIKALYSPSHEVAVDRRSDHEVVAGYEEMDVLPDTDFELYYSVAREEIGLNLLSTRREGEDGFYLMLVAPQVEVEQSEVVARDVILVLDTSGSMRGEKLAQAQKALSYVLGQLHEEDRLNVVAFSTGVRAFERRPVEASPSARAGARRWVDELQASGGTDIHRAMLEALSQLDARSAGAERPAIVIFLTDGLATEGVTQTEQILRDVEQAAPEGVRVFAFGVGDEVNTVLLDRLARDHRGASAYVRPGQRIDEIVSSFYAKVSTPLLADVEIDYGDVWVEDTYPYPLPDLFAGTQIVIAGRYREGGETSVTLTGTVNGERRTFVYDDVQFLDRQPAHDFARGRVPFIPRLWATRKVGHLLNQVRLHGESQELVREIVELAVRYGIMTPYTSFLVREDVDLFSEEGRRLTAERQYSDLAAQPPAAPSGKAAVDQAESQMALESAGTATGATGTAVKVVRDKVFLLREGVWTDTAFDAERMQPLKVGFLSEDYFRLIAARPEWGAFLSIGERVLVVLPTGATGEGLTAYQVVGQGEGEPIPIPGPLPVQVVLPAPQATATPAATSTPEAEVTRSPTSTGQALATRTTTPPLPARGKSLCPGAVAATLLLALIGAVKWPL